MKPHIEPRRSQTAWHRSSPRVIVMVIAALAMALGPAAIAQADEAPGDPQSQVLTEGSPGAAPAESGSEFGTGGGDEGDSGGGGDAGTEGTGTENTGTEGTGTGGDGADEGTVPETEESEPGDGSATPSSENAPAVRLAPSAIQEKSFGEQRKNHDPEKCYDHGKDQRDQKVQRDQKDGKDRCDPPKHKKLAIELVIDSCVPRGDGGHTWAKVEVDHLQKWQHYTVILKLDGDTVATKHFQAGTWDSKTLAFPITSAGSYTATVVGPDGWKRSASSTQDAVMCSYDVTPTVMLSSEQHCLTPGEGAEFAIMAEFGDLIMDERYETTLTGPDLALASHFYASGAMESATFSVHAAGMYTETITGPGEESSTGMASFEVLACSVTPPAPPAPPVNPTPPVLASTGVADAAGPGWAGATLLLGILCLLSAAAVTRRARRSDR